jgi:hypothetical protein
LKESGFIEKGARGEAKADWNKFAADCLDGTFLDKVRDERLAPVLLTKPPSRQIVNAAGLSWSSVEPPSTVTELFLAIRRTRNNLFHGGKHGEPDAKRSEALIADAIHVLIEALKAYCNI